MAVTGLLHICALRGGVYACDLKYTGVRTDLHTYLHRVRASVPSSRHPCRQSIRFRRLTRRALWAITVRLIAFRTFQKLLHLASYDI